MIDRRMMLTSLGLSALGAGLSGCAALGGPLPAEECFQDPRLSSNSTPLTIDSHVHVFNGSDLQISQFLSVVVLPDNEAMRVAAPVLQGLAWTLAPSGRDELRKLKGLTGSNSCDERALIAAAQRDGKTQYDIGRQQLTRALEAAQPRLQKFAGHKVDRLTAAIRSLPQSYERYKEEKVSGARALDFKKDETGIVDFLLQNFHYRYVTALDYLREYSGGKERKIDMMVAHLVDYDWPLGRPAGTSTPFADQVAVMAEMSRATGGRVQYFAPFDPFKEIAFGLGLAAESSLALVQDAVTNQGALGVKLYPPMGFAPLGNSKYPPSTWAGSVLTPSLKRDDIGQRLDASLKELFTWCEASDTPIMAHTSPSNLADAAYRDLLDPHRWEDVLDSFGGLRIDLGHFGQTAPSESAGSGDREKTLAGLMTAAPGSRGEFLYADGAYFSDAISQPAKLESILKNILLHTEDKGVASLAHRLMYGTDWEMLLVEGRAGKNYLGVFEQIFGRLSKDPALSPSPQSDDFFGRNAVRFLGLEQGSPGNRRRLESFYARGGTALPAWLAKVDGAQVRA